MRSSDVRVGIGPDGTRVLSAVEPSGIVVSIPFSEQGAKEVAAALTGIAIAQVLPPDARPPAP